MTKQQQWLDELRDSVVPGQVGSGGYCPRKDVIEDMCATIGIPFPFETQVLKSDLRAKVNAYFDERNEQ